MPQQNHQPGNSDFSHFILTEATAGYPISGRIRLSIGEESFEAEPGDSWCIPSHIEHQAEIIEDSVAIEVFSPVREDYLPDKPV